MCTQTQDRQGIPAWSASKKSLAKVPAISVQDVRIGYIQDVLVFEKLQIIVKPMAGSVSLYDTTTATCNLHHTLVPTHTPTMSDKTFNVLQWNANGIGNKQTELSIFLETHNVSGSHSGVQAHRLTVFFS